VRRYRQLTDAAFVRHKTIFVSEKLRSNYARFAPHDALRREFVVHNFIDYSRLRAITHGKPKEAEDGISVLIAARLDVTKGVGAFLSELANKMPPNMIVTIAGDGPDHDSLRAKFKSDVVRFLGWQPYDEVIMRLCASDIAVVPSLWEESCGTTVIEALSVGKRVFALARGGTPELKCYERYPGQLEVYPDMPALVQGLARPVPVVRCANLDDFAADVHHILDQVVAVYRT
jgi:glycosyltransferase involved in cell wall biosynthesis